MSMADKHPNDLLLESSDCFLEIKLHADKGDIEVFLVSIDGRSALNTC